MTTPSLEPLDDAPPEPRLRIYWRWTRIFLGHAARTLVWMALTAILAVEAEAWLLPQDFTNTNDWYIRLAAVAFFVRAFQMHIAIGLVALLLAALVTRARRAAVITGVLAVVLAFPYLREYLPKDPPRPVTKTLRVMSINLWAKNRDGTAILRAIEEADPDVLILAEVTPWSSTEIIHGVLKARYPYFHANRYDGGADVLSRVPFRVEPSPLGRETKFPRQPLVFAIEEREFSLYPVHLVSPGRPWLVRYNRQQVDSFSQLIHAEQRPMMIVGDFNFTQMTPNAFRLRREGFRSTHELAGAGLGNTWGPRWWPWLNLLPGVRIDHMFIESPLTATSHYVGDDTGSDHRPIVAEIGFVK